MKPLPIDSDLDVLCSDIDTADERQENGSYRVRCERGEISRDLTAARDQSLLLGAVFLGMADSTKHRSFIAEEGAEPSNDQVLQVAGRDPPPLRMIPGGPRDQ